MTNLHILCPFFRLGHFGASSENKEKQLEDLEITVVHYFMQKKQCKVKSSKFPFWDTYARTLTISEDLEIFFLSLQTRALTRQFSISKSTFYFLSIFYFLSDCP